MEPSERWEINDKVWMKNRRAHWKIIKKRLDKLSFLSGDEKGLLKDYYIKGEVNEDCFYLLGWFELTDEYKNIRSKVWMALFYFNVGSRQTQVMMTG